MTSGLDSGKWNLILELFISFLKIGPTTFGGGYAILPVIDKEVTEHRKWLTGGEMTEITALSGAAPGGIGVNVAALVGYRIAGIPGLAASVLGISLPTIVIMFALCVAATGFSDNPLVQAALKGIKPTVVALIVFAAIRMGKQALKRSFAWTIAIVCIVLLLLTPIHPLLILGLGVASGLVSEAYTSRIAKHRHKQQSQHLPFH